ncbi:MAG: dipeptide ABC transporter ATP-binding protein [Pseudobacteriovorax sp.]|nr:dipeptide ABC transporter ATP-binding protein [Pseudobacteriovorax sp.]
MTPLLEVRGLKTYFPVFGGVFNRKIAEVKAVQGLSFHISEGEILGLVGESGCGKSTTGRSLMMLNQPTEGQILFEGQDLRTLNKKHLRSLRKQIQMIFQDPFESLNPKHSVGQILSEPFLIHQPNMTYPARRRAVLELLDRVGLNPDSYDKYPFEFSGGQRQRIGIARAISQKPKLVICDEPVSALDVSVQSQVINLLLDLQNDLGLSYLFIAHDLSVVRHVSDRVAVMYLGKIVEITDADSIYLRPQHPYTKALIDAIPTPDPESEQKVVALEGDFPSPLNPPSGCQFRTRCPIATEECARAVPELKTVDHEKNHFVACHKVNTRQAKVKI